MKRARYDGPHTAVVIDPNGLNITVERGHLLPVEHNGENVPAKLRDELLARDDWTEVDQAAGRKEN